MSRGGRKPVRHMIDGREMTVAEIADMLGITQGALESRRSKLGRPSYQVIVNMYRENQFGNAHDRSPRHMVDGQWMSRKQIAQMLGVTPHTLANWLYTHPKQDMRAAISYYRQRQTDELKRGHGTDGRPPRLYKVGKRMISVPQVMRMFGVCHSAVHYVLKKRGGDMAATIRHYREREARRKRKAEKEIMRILGF